VSKRLVTVNGVKYSCKVLGVGDPIVCLHGFTGTSASWDAAVSKWKEHFRIILVDLPGHGDSQHILDRTIDMFCADLKEII